MQEDPPSRLIRDQIRDAAADRFKTYGYTKTTMAEIAEDTGMSAANLYRYFANKQDIAADCTRKYINDRSSLLEKTVTNPELNAGEKLKAYFFTTLQFSYRMAHEHNKISQLVETITLDRKDIVHLKIESEKSIITSAVIFLHHCNVVYFHCEECHAQHGNKNYRNLRLRPGGIGSDIKVTYVLNGNGSKPCSDGVTFEPCDVHLDTVSNPLAQTNLTKFQRSNVTFRKASGNSNGIAAWCGGCHTNFHGAGGAASMGGTSSGDVDGSSSSYWLRHPVRDVSINEANTNKHADRSNWAGLSSSVRVRAVDPDGSSPTSGNADELPFCLTCHYAHGGGNPSADSTLDHSNLMFLDSAGRINIDASYDSSSSRIRNLCQQCHNQ